MIEMLQTKYIHKLNISRNSHGIPFGKNWMIFLYTIYPEKAAYADMKN